MAFSPDDRMVVAGSWDQTLRFWNAETGAAIGPPLTAHAAGVNAVAFSPNGREVASGSQEGEVRLWDVQSRLPQGRPIRVGDKVNAVAFSPDGTLLATASRNRTVRLWRVDTGESFGRPLVGAGEVQDVAFSPDGKTLAGGDWGGTARLWRVDTGEQIGQPVPDTGCRPRRRLQPGRQASRHRERPRRPAVGRPVAQAPDAGLHRPHGLRLERGLQSGRLDAGDGQHRPCRSGCGT